MKTVSVRGPKGSDPVFALVDDADFERVSARAWRLRNGYAFRRVEHTRKNGKRIRRHIPMHRFILGLQPGDPGQVDHCNRNKLDNRRENLRIVTNKENHQNLPPFRRHAPRATPYSPYRGVHWDPSTRKWKAVACKERQRFYLGLFENDIEAARVVSRWRAEHMPFSDADQTGAALAEAA